VKSEGSNSGDVRIPHFKNSYSPAQDAQSNLFEPVIATRQKTEFYKDYARLPVMIEGPEFSNDFTFFLVKMNKELLKFEQGIPLTEFRSLNCAKKVEL